MLIVHTINAAFDRCTYNKNILIVIVMFIFIHWVDVVASFHTLLMDQQVVNSNYKALVVLVKLWRIIMVNMSFIKFKKRSSFCSSLLHLSSSHFILFSIKLFLLASCDSKNLSIIIIFLLDLSTLSNLEGLRFFESRSLLVCCLSEVTD